MFPLFFSGANKGYFNSTTHNVSDGTSEATTLGTSGETVGVNVSNGNLILDTTDLKFPAPGLANVLRRTYRGQSSGWQIGTTPFVKIPQDNNPTIMYGHEDGFTSTFRKNTEDNNYSCYWPAGRVTLTKNADGSSQIYIPSSGLTETFDARGFLLTRTTWDGGTLVYDYDSQGRLFTITDSLGKILSLDYQGQTVSIKYDGKEYLQYHYDDCQRLAGCTHLLGDSKTYSIQFAYEGTGMALTGVSQSDGTVLEVAYRDFKVINIGTPGAHQTINYESAGLTRITSAEGSYTKWSYDTSTSQLKKHENFNKNDAKLYGHWI